MAYAQTDIAGQTSSDAPSREMICVSSKYSSVPTSDLAKFFGCLNTHLGDLCVHLGDEWAFGQMSRKTWFERVKVSCACALR